MIIKPHLAESARALVAEKLKQEAFHIGVVGLGVVGMNAGGDAHPRHARTGLPSTPREHVMHVHARLPHPSRHLIVRHAPVFHRIHDRLDESDAVHARTRQR